MKKIIISLMVLMGISTQITFAEVNKAKIRKLIKIMQKGVGLSRINEFKRDPALNELEEKRDRLEATFSPEELAVDDEIEEALRSSVHNLRMDPKYDRLDSKSKRIAIIDIKNKTLKKEARKYNNWFENCTDSKLKRTGFFGLAALVAAATAYGIAYYNTPAQDTNVQQNQSPKSRAERALASMTSKLKNPFVLAALGAATIGAGYWIYKG